MRIGVIKTDRAHPDFILDKPSRGVLYAMYNDWEPTETDSQGLGLEAGGYGGGLGRDVEHRRPMGAGPDTDLGTYGTVDSTRDGRGDN